MSAFSTFMDSKAGKRLSHAGWAEEFGCSRSFITHMKQGHRRPSLETAYKIEQATEGAVTMQSWFTSVEDGILPGDAEMASAG